MNFRKMVDEPNLSLADLERIDAICVQFEAAYCSEQEPAIEIYVQNADERLRRQLLRELLETEWEVRGAVQTETHYIERLPEYGDIVGAFFHDLGQPEKQRGQQATTMLRSISEADTPAAVADVTEPVASVPVIAGYDILEELGRGGMGIVYRGKQLAADRMVAVKMIREGRHAEAEYLHRFRHEAEAVARLQHPHIVQIFEVGDCNGAPFFSLEYCEGGSLEAQLDGKPWPIQEAARLVETLAQAMEHAHQRQVVHRDLKPGNVLFTADGTVKITDFGLAKKLDQTAHTRSGVIVGTPSYMAPEQADSQIDAVGPATDVYALGAILYELVTGRPPFQSETALDTVLQVLQEDVVPPARLNGTVPRDMETICLKCLEKNPARRFASANQLGDDLQRFLEGRPIHARRVGAVEKGWRWCRRNPRGAGLLGAAFGLLLALVVLAIVYANERSFAARNALTLAQEKTAESKKARRLVEQLYAAKGMRLAEDGRLLEGLHWILKPLRREHGDVEWEQQHRLRFAAYWRFSNRPALMHILHHPNAVNPAYFTPDGRHIVAVHRPGVSLWDSRNGKKIGSLPEKQKMLAVSTDGRYVLAVTVINRRQQIQVWDIIKRAPLGKPLRHTKQIHNAVFTPDGRQLATVDSDYMVRLWETQTGTPLAPLGQPPIPGTSVVFSPDGRRIATTHKEVLFVWNAATGQQIVKFRSEKIQAGRVRAFSPDGRWVVTIHRYTAHIWDTKTKKPAGPALRHRDVILSVAFSPDSRRVATASADFTAQVWDTATGQHVGAPLRHQFFVHQAVFSPDGRHIITSGDDKTARIWDVETGRPLTPFLHHQGAVYTGAFSPDGRRFLTASDDRTLRVWQSTDNPFQISLVHKASVGRASFCPAGRYVLTTTRDAKWIWDSTTGQRIGPPRQQGVTLGYGTIQNSGLQAVFDTNGRHLVLTTKKQTQIQDVRTGKTVGPILSHGANVFHVCLSADGRRLAVARMDQSIDVWDVASRKRLCQTPKHPGYVQVSLSEDGQHLVTLAKEILQVRNATTGQPVGPAIHSPKTVGRVLLSSDGRRLAVATDGDYRVRIWDTASGTQIAKPFPHDQWVHRMAFSRDGRRLLTGSSDHTARVWDLDTGQALGPPLRHKDEVCWVAFSPDGERAATASYDKTARVWDVATGQPLSPPLVHDETVRYVVFSPDGKRLITTSEDKTTRIWDMSADARSVEDLVRLTELLHGYRLDRLGALVPLKADDQIRLLRIMRKQFPKELPEF